MKIFSWEVLSVHWNSKPSSVSRVKSSKYYNITTGQGSGGTKLSLRVYLTMPKLVF